MKKIIMMLIIAASAIGIKAANTPSFPGGETALMGYISENLQYPENPKELGIEGVVSVSFTVKADGTIGNIKINRSVDPDLESEAIRLVKKMPKWIPAEENGTPVDSQAEMEVSFTL